jgi:hypothetical protein
MPDRIASFVMSGGVGSRLWPLSREDNLKQLQGLPMAEGRRVRLLVLFTAAPRQPTVIGGGLWSLSWLCVDTPTCEHRMVAPAGFLINRTSVVNLISDRLLTAANRCPSACGTTVCPATFP